MSDTANNITITIYTLIKAAIILVLSAIFVAIIAFSTAISSIHLSDNFGKTIVTKSGDVVFIPKDEKVKYLIKPKNENKKICRFDKNMFDTTEKCDKDVPYSVDNLSDVKYEDLGMIEISNGIVSTSGSIAATQVASS